MIKKKASLGLLLAVAMMAAGCDDDLTDPSAVIGGAWRLQSLEIPGRGLVQVANPASYTVEFRDSGRVAIRADCNVCGGSYSISGESMKIGATNCTAAFCGAASLDTAFVTILNEANTFSVENGELTINSLRGIAHFRQ